MVPDCSHCGEPVGEVHTYCVERLGMPRVYGCSRVRCLALRELNNSPNIEAMLPKWQQARLLGVDVTFVQYLNHGLMPQGIS